MNYDVFWTPEAQNGLAAAWVAAADKNAVTAASHRFDQNLARDPYAVGIPLGSPQVRTVSEPPLMVDYEIVEDDRKVRVLRVWSVV